MQRYNLAMVVLHWMLAVLIIGALFMGLAVLDEMDSNNQQKILLLKLHVIAGGGILLLTLFRLALRLYTQQPETAPNQGVIQQKLSQGVHQLLYFLTLATAISGGWLAFVADLPSILFGHAGGLPHDFDDFMAHEAHEIFADLLLLTIALHTAAALYHHFILQDGLLSRMSLRQKK